MLQDMIDEGSESINWNKVLPMAKYEGKAPPIILDNIDEIIVSDENTLHEVEEDRNLEVCNVSEI